MDKELLLYTGIYNSTAEAFINSMEEAKDDNVTIRINGPGGDVFAGWGMIAKLKEHTGQSKIKVDGHAASMHFNFMLYGDDVEVLDVSKLMFHRASMYIENEADQKFLDNVNKDLRRVIESKVDKKLWEEITGHSIKSLFESEDRVDVWLDPKDAKKLGLVNKIVKISDASANDETFKRLVAMTGFNITNSKKQGEKTENSIMTKEELKQKHPELYASIVKEGVDSERDRVESWLVFNDVDSKAVAEGIESGKEISRKSISDFQLKVMSSNTLDNAKSDSEGDINDKTPKSKEEKKEDELNDFYKKSVDSAIKNVKLA